MKRLAGVGPLLLALLAAVLVHAPALRAPFFADDYLFLDQVRARSLGAVLASPDPIGNYFRPLGRQLWFWALAGASGESPVVFHAANLLLLLACIVLLWAIARRVAGEAAAGVAAAVFALGHAADVPVRWACGSQDLLAVAFALAALLAHQQGRRAIGAASLFAALLAKETVVLAPVVAVALTIAAGTPWRASARRAWPLGAAVLAWVALAAWAASRRAVPGAGVELDPAGLPAAMVLLARTALGLEWRAGGAPFAPAFLPGPGVWAAIALAALGGAIAASRGARTGGAAAMRPGDKPHAARAAQAEAGPAPGHPDAPRAWRAGVVWALLGALPVAAVASVWSAYYFLFALAGVALVVGALVAARSATAAIAVVAMGLLAHQARGLDEFASGPGMWTTASHVNRHYLERGQRFVADGVQQLRALHPTVPPRTTFFFSNLPPFAAWQVADGPLVRWVYRDTSVRSHYFTDITDERVRRGPTRWVMLERATVRFVDQSADSLLFVRSALGAMLAARPATLSAVLRLELERRPASAYGLYLSALEAWERGDADAARSLIERRGWSARAGGEAAIAAATARVAAGDTAGALALALQARRDHALDPGVHALLCDLMMRHEGLLNDAAIEAWAARVLAPGWPDAWRRWAAVQFVFERWIESMRSVERYWELDPAARTTDTATAAMVEQLRAYLPGGVVSQQSLREDLSAPAR